MTTDQPKGLCHYNNGSKDYWMARVTVHGKRYAKSFEFTEQGKLSAIAWLSETKATAKLWTDKPAQRKKGKESIPKEPMVIPEGTDMRNISPFTNGTSFYLQVRMYVRTERHNKTFPQTKDGLAAAIKYRNSLRKLR